MKFNIAISILFTSLFTMSAQAVPSIFEGADTGASWKQVADHQWTKFVHHDGNIVRIDYVVTDEGPAYTFRAECGNETVSFGLIGQGKKIGFSRSCEGQVGSDFTLHQLVEEVGKPQ